jgi:hypothetical protein
METEKKCRIEGICILILANTFTYIFTTGSSSGDGNRIYLNKIRSIKVASCATKIDNKKAEKTAIVIKTKPEETGI